MGRLQDSKNRKKLAAIQVESALKEHEVYQAQMDYTLKTVNMMENYFAGRDEDDALWHLHGNKNEGRGDLDENDIRTFQDQSYLFYKTNPHARAVIRALQKFTIGRGVMVDHLDNRPEVRNYWDRFVRENKWNRRQKEIAKRLFRDGEVFLWKKRIHAKGKSTIILRFIEPFEIAPNDEGNPSFGIATEPKDVETPLWYNRRVMVDDQWTNERLPAADVFHFKLNSDSTQKRGVPILEPVMGYLKKYEQWLNDRIVLNKVRTAVALIKKYVATPEQLSTFRSENRGTQQTSGSNKSQKMLEPGTVIHATQGIDYEFLAPKLDARDVAADGRAILLSIAAGTGLAEYIVTGDSSNANYSSTLIAESPAVREIEDYQSWLEDFFLEIYSEVMGLGLKIGDIPMPEENEEEQKFDLPITQRADFIFPSLIHRDFFKENQGLEIQRENRIISIKTWQEKMDLDPENEAVNMSLEDRDAFTLDKELGDGID